MNLLSPLALCFFLTYTVKQGGAALALDARIVGGQNATVAQFPFAAAISVRTATGNFFCGGALHRREWIITAGQCVDGAISFTIQLGSIHLNSDEETTLLLSSSEYYLHPDYNPQTLENDIGIIKLRSEITWTDYIRGFDFLPVHEIEEGLEVTAIGWGQISDQESNFAAALQHVKVTALSNEECRITYGNQIKDNMLCIAGNYNEGTCHGDTGSPLIDVYSNRFTVVSGIASFVSGNGCESTDPSGYTRVFYHKEWITSITIH